MSNKIKCFSCHTVFDEAELELIQVDGGTYITACPKCNGDNWQYEEKEKTTLGIA